MRCNFSSSFHFGILFQRGFFFSNVEDASKDMLSTSLEIVHEALLQNSLVFTYIKSGLIKYKRKRKWIPIFLTFRQPEGPNRPLSLMNFNKVSSRPFFVNFWLKLLESTPENKSLLASSPGYFPMVTLLSYMYTHCRSKATYWSATPFENIVEQSGLVNICIGCCVDSSNGLGFCTLSIHESDTLFAGNTTHMVLGQG